MTCESSGPVCLVPKTDPPVVVPSALAAGFLGQATTCQLTGESDLTVTVGDQTRTSPLAGHVELSPAPEGGCAAGQTCLGMSYRVDATRSLDFDALLGTTTIRLRDLEALGASTPFGLDATGAGEVPAESTQTSGRGTEKTEIVLLPDSTRRVAMFGVNDEPIDVVFDARARRSTGHCSARSARRTATRST